LAEMELQANKIFETLHADWFTNCTSLVF
jgi:hypothetical protein